MTEALRHELGSQGIRVVLVEPGPYRTEIFTENRWYAKAAGSAAATRALWQQLERFTEKASQNQGDPSEVAALVAQLLRDPAPDLRWPIGPSVRARLLLLHWLPFMRWEKMLAERIRKA